MPITAQDIAKLRAQTGAGMMDCKNALEETGGDFDKAVEALRKKGTLKAAKRAGKVAAEGKIFSYLHAGGRIGVILELNSETDFVAKNEKFLQLGQDIAMHIAAMNPRYVSREEVPAEEVEKEKDVYRAQLQQEGKPAEIIEKILVGKVDKYFSDICLLDQSFIKNEDKTVGQLLTAMTGEIGEKITLRRFARYEVGEGLEKKSDNFVDEVQAQLGE